MRIICPFYPEVSPETIVALENYIVEYIELDDNFGYYNLLKGIWKIPEDIILIEQDIVPWSGAIEKLIATDKDWCGYGYSEQTPEVSFGLVKLTKKHMEKIPDLWDSMRLRNWRDVCNHHGTGYAEQGIKPYQLKPAILNLSAIEPDNKESAITDQADKVAEQNELAQLKQLLQDKGIVTKAELDQAAQAITSGADKVVLP